MKRFFVVAATCWLHTVGVAAEVETQATKSAPTFHRDIAPLVFRHCSRCHRPGEVAPFSLLSYDDLAKRAEHVADITARRAMPPWKPEAGHATYLDERRLNDAEIALLRRWADAGAPEGNPQDAPSPPTFPDGWQLGTPDMVLTLPDAIAIPAEGRDVYKNLILPLRVPTGKFLKALEFRPGNPRVVHHAVLAIDVSGTARKRDAETPGPGFDAVSPPGRFMPGSLGIWTPGRTPLPLPEGLSMPWPDNADLVLNLHLHPSGKPEIEQSTVGCYFTDEPPRRSLYDLILIDTTINIAPGEKEYRTTSTAAIPFDVDALTIFPHMHMLGKSMRVTATMPDGTTQTLLNISDWDYNWQDTYQFAPLVRLPRGTQLLMEAVHDNSADNPQNPRDPPQRVVWGEQTFNEMSLAFLSLLPVKEEDTRPTAGERHRLRPGIRAAGSPGPDPSAPPSRAAAVRPTIDDATARAAAFMKKADGDADGRLSATEITAALGGKTNVAAVTKDLARFDRDGDLHLNLEEAIEATKALKR
jgi:mono/diheme cytochrome c family protein